MWNANINMKHLVVQNNMLVYFSSINNYMFVFCSFMKMYGFKYHLCWPNSVSEEILFVIWNDEFGIYLYMLLLGQV